jgi:16S rRNA (guanine527-N7)-methyltransferase
MNPQKIRHILEGYLKPLPGGIEFKIQKYLNLLDQWGRKMSLTSVRDPEEVVRFHFGESIFALSVAEIADGRLADVGSGPGFPGLALKLVRPGLSVTLIEPNKKKCTFLHEVVRSLELSNVEIISVGFETSKIPKHSLSFVTCRALGEYGAILKWAKEELISDGSVLFWIGEAECDDSRTNDDWLWEDRVQIPGTNARLILIGRRKT